MRWFEKHVCVLAACRLFTQETRIPSDAVESWLVIIVGVIETNSIRVQVAIATIRVNLISDYVRWHLAVRRFQLPSEFKSLLL